MFDPFTADERAVYCEAKIRPYFFNHSGIQNPLYVRIARNINIFIYRHVIQCIFSTACLVYCNGKVKIHHT